MTTTQKCSFRTDFLIVESIAASLEYYIGLREAIVKSIIKSKIYAAAAVSGLKHVMKCMEEMLHKLSLL